ncbi:MULTISPECIES: hypothetical protein [unclassified Solwaraspora]|uniref:hypothetical protein n=1 Tax=unclassified Solwaraspora TaxID=2627926 RepID=UPI00248BC680|nr:MULTISPECIES: hypothetical protein [unclassified Solwaraspora]WBB99453.1 hypothetical protein O7553_11520 [Solwaraspora sp. WMMA2059]WBC21997.1 hypothetical protein O7543_05855 [Solwaraspora sp. WMMA2080]WJK35956.1 hypothetical protein O7610_06275 [Solwaraspora sp. WMMA2065]
MRTLLIVDGANVVGSRPDGWWRDRMAAAVRLRDQLVDVAGRGLPELTGPLEVVLVVEGAARGLPPAGGVRIGAALGSGDDLIVEIAAEGGPDRRVVVVTADRRLRDRVTDVGAQVRGPRWLTRQLTGPVSEF